MRTFAFCGLLAAALSLPAQTIGDACTRTDHVDHHWTSTWQAKAGTAVCATAYVYNATDWVAYRMSEVTSPPTNIAHHFTSRAEAISWVEAQNYVASFSN